MENVLTEVLVFIRDVVFQAFGVCQEGIINLLLTELGQVNLGERGFRMSDADRPFEFDTFGRHGLFAKGVERP